MASILNFFVRIGHWFALKGLFILEIAGAVLLCVAAVVGIRFWLYKRRVDRLYEKMEAEVNRIQNRDFAKQLIYIDIARARGRYMFEMDAYLRRKGEIMNKLRAVYQIYANFIARIRNIAARFMNLFSGVRVLASRMALLTRRKQY